MMEPHGCLSEGVEVTKGHTGRRGDSTCPGLHALKGFLETDGHGVEGREPRAEVMTRLLSTRAPGLLEMAVWLPLLVEASTNAER